MKRMLLGLALALTVVPGMAERTLSLADYRDKMKAAWIGQMVGVAWGMPTEFRWNDEIVPADRVPVWTSDMPVKSAYNNDDLYVEMTFLKTLEDYGLDLSPRQAGIDFANSEYKLWCANLLGRTNLRSGIAPPDCSHPRHDKSPNKCPNDIDYQIEADYSGIISPGCPDEAIRLGRIFGRLMNWGDGVWAGQFIGALYAEAFFSDDVNRLLNAGIAAIPPESDYAQMVRNVRSWHDENPDDWETCWKKIRANYSKRFNPAMKDSNGGIDVRLNGAAVVLGLLYGEGDLDKSMVLAMRCGWDSDCNPSSVGGILMTARGFKSLPAKYTEKLDYELEFSYTAYNLPKLFAVCEKLAREVVIRNGGRIETGTDGEERFVIPERRPVPDRWEPSWNAPAPTGSYFTAEEIAKIRRARPLPPSLSSQNSPDPTERVQKALDALAPGWTTSENGAQTDPGFVCVSESTAGQIDRLVRTHPPQSGSPVVLRRVLKVPDGRSQLSFQVMNAPKGAFRLTVRIDGDDVLSTNIDDWNKDNWCGFVRNFALSLKPWAGKDTVIELIAAPASGQNAAALWRNIRIGAKTAD